MPLGWDGPVGDLLLLLSIGALSGVTTVLFGFGGGFVTVPVVLWVDASLGAPAPTVAVATSSVVMVINAAVATLATRRQVLTRLRPAVPLLALLAVGGAIGALLARVAPSPVITWGFISYLVVTIADVTVRKGFVQPTRQTAATADRFEIRSGLGAPIGAVASFLGVGGSVMTVPLLRRAGLDMRTVTSLANPLTLAISLPACIVFLVGNPVGDLAGAALVGAVDLRAAGLLLAGGLPVIVLLRRRPPAVSDRTHALGYIVLLCIVLGAMVRTVLA